MLDSAVFQRAISCYKVITHSSGIGKVLHYGHRETWPVIFFHLVHTAEPRVDVDIPAVVKALSLFQHPNNYEYETRSSLINNKYLTIFWIDSMMYRKSHWTTLLGILQWILLARSFGIPSLAREIIQRMDAWTNSLIFWFMFGQQ